MFPGNVVVLKLDSSRDLSIALLNLTRTGQGHFEFFLYLPSRRWSRIDRGLLLLSVLVITLDFVYGDQITDAYSTIVLTKAKYALNLTAFGHCFKFLCKKPRTECALLVININVFIPAEIAYNGNLSGHC